MNGTQNALRNRKIVLHYFSVNADFVLFVKFNRVEK